MTNTSTRPLAVRTRILTGVWVSLLSLLGVRLIDVQLHKGSEFRVQADDNRFFTQRLVANRGVLLDRYGEPLVWNQRRYYTVADPQSLHPTKQFIDRETALVLLATRSAEVGFTTEREYRYPEVLAQVVGYVAPVTVEDLEQDPTLSSQHQVGKLGLEKSFDERLRGIDGKEVVEINALGQKQRVIKHVEPQSGQAIQTTLDPELAQVAWQALGDHPGAVVISDASSGALLAVVNKPSFDANLISQVPIDDQERQSRASQLSTLFTDPRKLFFNRAVAGAYPPGSVFKLVTALAGLESGAITAETSVVDEGILKVGEYEYRNWYFTQYGRTEGEISLVRALARSNDIYFYKAAEFIGPSKLAEFARIFGFGKAPGSQLSGEAVGLVPDPEWKEQKLGERWFLGNTYHFGIGQGDLLVSPLQIASLGQAIANNGMQCQPSFTPQQIPDCREISVHTENMELILQGMLDACSPGGTAFPFFAFNQARRVTDQDAKADLESGAVACKTGTAEFGGADANGHRRTHGWFLAIVEPKLSSTAPSDPQQLKWWERARAQGFPRRLVITVLTESNDQIPFKEGSREAAPVAKSIVDWLNGAAAPTATASAGPASSR